MNCEQWLSIIQTVALVITLVVLIIYTIQTGGLKKSTVKQTELQLRPFVIFCCSYEDLMLKNIGHSPALNISIDDFESDDFTYKFDKRGSLESNQDVKIRFIKVGHNDPEGTSYELTDNFREIGREVYLTIRYWNIENKKYFSKVRILPWEDRVEFLETDKE